MIASKVLFWGTSYLFICYLGRGWRPSYRDVLLQVREKLKIPCSRKLPTEDLEAEIFLHLMQEYSRFLSLSIL